jgi:hypothetical protein
MKYCEDTISFAKKTAIQLACRIYAIRHDNLWAGRWGNFEDFLHDAGISTSNASKMCSTVDVWIEKYKIPMKELEEIPWTKLYAAIPLATDTATAKLALEMAKTMHRDQIVDEVREKSGVDMDCKHPKSAQEDYKRCRDCGRFHRV